MTQVDLAPPFHSVETARRQFFPGRSERWVRQRCRAGDFGDLVRDGGGWLIPERGILHYLERRRVRVGTPPAARCEQVSNLIQFQA